MGLIQKIKNNSLTWIYITNPNAGSVEYLRQNYNFDPLDLEMCINETTGATLSEYDDYLFMVLNFPVFDRATKTISLSKLNIFIGKNYLITINNKKLEPLTRIFDNSQINENEKQKYLGDDATALLYKLLDELQKYCFPILNHIFQDMENIENHIFNHEEQKMVREILLVKRNIVNCRKSVQSHKNLIKKFEKMSYKNFLKDDLHTYFANIFEQAKEIWEILENHKETIEALHNTNESLISFKLNRIMKTLTIISVLIFPATLVSSMFGMNYIIPFQESPLGFWAAVFIIIIGMLILFWSFKKKNWLD